MGNPDWGRWQVIIGGIALVVALAGLIIHESPDPNNNANNINVTNINNPPVSTPTTTQPISSISVSSYPAGASVYLDGEYKGEVPQIFNNIEQGSHSIILKLAEYKDWSQDISVDAGKTVSISPTLTPTEPLPEPSPEPQKDTSNLLYPQEAETPTPVDISPYLDWTFTTSDSASYATVPEGDSYVTVTIHIKNDGNIPISTASSCWTFTSDGVSYSPDDSTSILKNYELLDVNPGEEGTFKMYYLVEGEPTTASLSYENPYVGT